MVTMEIEKALSIVGRQIPCGHHARKGKVFGAIMVIRDITIPNRFPWAYVHGLL